MDTLIISQIIFYIVSSLAILVLGVLLAMAVYQLLRILKNTRELSNDISATYATAKKGIINAIKSIFSSKGKSKK